MENSSFNIPTEVFNPDLLLTALRASKSKASLLKKHIERSTDYFHQQFRQGTDIRDLVWGRAKFIDQLLHATWQTYDWGTKNDICLIAVGGYGRGELHPHSDIDLLILLNDEDALQNHQENISDLVTLLWDINLDIGHSVRTITDTQAEAQKDITTVTNLMESRVLIGNGELHQDMMTLVEPDKIWPSQAFFRAKWDEQLHRHRKHGNSEYKLEANIKNSPGGLRDIQMIGWVGQRHYGITLDQFVGRGLLSEEELSIFNRGLDFLWKVRYALHMIAGREEDRLLFDHQRTLAKMFGYDDDSAKMAVEQFMQYYYRWALSLGELNDVLMQHFDESILRAKEKEDIYQLNERFCVHNGHIEVRHPEVFKETPSALLEIFYLLATDPKIDGVRAATIRLIRLYRDLIDDDFRNDPKNAQYFIAILRAKQKVALQLRRMLRFGVLGKYLPEFGKIIGQMQHDLFHIYSVDAHTMEVIKNMRRFHYTTMEEKFPVAARIVKRLPKVELLYIAGLYHDIAKGRGGDHSTLGVVDARAFCQRHELNKHDTNLVCWLVEHHLLMSSVAQRQDISDPEVIAQFATTVGDQQRLDYLYALTVADINATNPTLWNSWRASLLRQLYAETKRTLRQGLENIVDKSEWVLETQLNAIDKLEDLGFSEEQIRALWQDTGEDYFLREKVDDIVWHTEAISRHEGREKPLVLLKESSDNDFEGATQIFIHTQSKENLFAVVAAALEQLNLNVQDARIYNTGDNQTVDTFFVLEQNGDAIGDNSERIDTIRKTLLHDISQTDDYLNIIKKRTPRQLGLFSIPTRTSMHTNKDQDQTVLEVITPDRPGLLARIGRIFAEYGVSLQNAKIATLGERVEDIFFITDKNNHAIQDPELCKAIQEAIRKELDEKAAA